MNGLAPHVVYEFGEFRLDATRRLLFAKGKPDALTITPKVFEALLYFVARPGELLEKDKLMADLWPGLIVEEGSLTQLISVLRRTLGEARGENRYFATVPGRGYRFVADVMRTMAPAETAPGAQSGTPTTQPGRARSRRLAPIVLVALAAVLGTALATYGWYAGWWPRRTVPPTDAAASEKIELPAHTVAILPFENLSADPDDEFVAFGVAESVLHRLASVPDLTLIARTSSFAFRHQRADARDIGRRLNARYLIEGSVHRAGDRLRVTAQLIDAKTGVHVWSLRFDRTIDDIFVVEDEISQSVARALEVSLREGTHPFARFGTEAYLAYLQGRALVATRKVADGERAIERFSHAIEIAPNFAAAYAALAGAHMHLADIAYRQFDSIDRVELAKRRAKTLLARALQLDDTLGEAYVLRAELKDEGGDKAGAEADYRKGLALNPNDGRGQELFANFLERQGRTDEALAAIDRARLVDPLYPRSHYFKGLLLMLHGRGSLKEIEALFLEALSVAPDFHPALMRLGTVRGAFMGRLAEAVNYSERAVAIDPRAIWMRVELSLYYLDLGDPDAARNVVAELVDPPRTVWVPICLYEYDLKGAQRALHGLDLDDIYLEQLHMSVLRAVRDRALAGGDPGDARKLMQVVAEKWDPAVSASTADRIRAVLAEHADEPGYYPWYHPEQILAAAQWRKSMGENRSAEDTARGALKWLDLVEAQMGHRRPAHWFDRRRAVALAILGQDGQALAALERGFAAGYLSSWWYDLDREPAFAAFRENPRFKTLATRVRAQVRSERKLLDEMRRDGTVPQRRRPTASLC